MTALHHHARDIHSWEVTEGEEKNCEHNRTVAVKKLRQHAKAKHRGQEQLDRQKWGKSQDLRHTYGNTDVSSPVKLNLKQLQLSMFVLKNLVGAAQPLIVALAIVTVLTTKHWERWLYLVRMIAVMIKTAMMRLSQHWKSCLQMTSSLSVVVWDSIWPARRHRYSHKCVLNLGTFPIFADPTALALDVSL